MNETREIQARLTKCMLELVVLQLLNERTMHGYEVIKQVRKEYGVYFGPSTIYRARLNYLLFAIDCFLLQTMTASSIVIIDSSMTSKENSGIIVIS